MLLILKELYSPQGVLADAEKNQPLASPQHVPDASFPLYSPSTCPPNLHKTVSSIPASSASEPSHPIPMFATSDTVPLLPPQTSEADSSSHTPPPPPQFSSFQPPPPSTSPCAVPQSPLPPFHSPSPPTQPPLSLTQSSSSALQPPALTSQSSIPPSKPPLLPPQPSPTPPKSSSSPLLPVTPLSGPLPSRGQLRVIGGRPVMELSDQPVGMDPTVRPSNTNPVGPPPKLSGMNFRRPAPFKR